MDDKTKVVNPDAAWDFVRTMRLWADNRLGGSWASAESDDVAEFNTLQSARKDISWEMEKGRLDR